MKRLLLVAPLVLISSLGFSGKKADPASVRVLQLSSDAPAVDVYVDGKLVAKDFKYKQITHFIHETAGKHQLEFKESGKASSVVVHESLNLKSGKAYTLVAQGHAEKSLKVIPVSTDTVITGDKARFRLVNLSGDVQAVDVIDGKGKVLFQKVPAQKPSAYVAMDPEDLVLDIRQTGVFS